MTGTQLLDAAIGVVLVILSFSLIASALSEALATALNWRGRMLRRGLFRLLEGDAGADLVERSFPGKAGLRRARLTLAFLNDPAIRVLHGPRGALAILWDRLAGWRQDPDTRAAARLGRLPSAIAPGTFARALVDTLARQVDLTAVEPAVRPVDAAAVTALAGRLEAAADRALHASGSPLERMALAPDLKDRVRAVVGCLSALREIRARLDGGDTVQAGVKAELEGVLCKAETRLRGVLDDLGTWFEQAMERVSGWYVRRSRLALFALGVVMAASVNTNLAGLGGNILQDDGLRTAVIEEARKRAESGLPPVRPAPDGEAVEDLRAGMGAARDRLAALPGRGGPGFGWSCAPGETWIACARRGVQLGAVISWLLIGLGCMMGGQFWYDILGSVLRFRSSARPLRRPV